VGDKLAEEQNSDRPFHDHDHEDLGAALVLASARLAPESAFAWSLQNPQL